MAGDADLSPIDVAVIGAGMAGLSAAVYARLSGLSVRVFERHFLPGGLCTAWKRKGYVFDYCIDYLMGSGQSHGFHEIWKELGVIDKTEFRRVDSFGRYVGSNGEVLDLYTDYRRLQDHLLSIAPEDALKIRELCKAIRRASAFRMSEFSLSPRGLGRLVGSLPALPTIRKWSGISVSEWCDGLRNPFLREAIPPLIGMVDFPMSGPIIVLGMMSRGNAAYPLGGSLPIARAVEARAKYVGAEFAYRAGVKRVVVEGGRAVGIELEDGRVQRARHVVAACDARSVFDRLLEGRVKDAGYEALFERKEIYPSLVQVSLGLRLDPAWGLVHLPKRLNLPLSSPVVVDGSEQERIGLYHYANDPQMAGEGRTVLVVQYEGDYDRWRALRADSAVYKAEKARILAETIRALETPFPGIGGRVEASDVATPTTCERYTGNWRGSTQGWLLTTELMGKLISGAQLPKAFPGVSHFHLIGQWTEPGGGLPPAARNGRDVVRVIMKADRRRPRARKREGRGGEPGARRLSVNTVGGPEGSA